MASEQTNSARYGSQAICKALARLKPYVIKFHCNNTEKINRKKKSLHRVSVEDISRLNKIARFPDEVLEAIESLN